MSGLRQLHAEKVVLLPLLGKGDLPMSRLRQLHAEKVVLLPLLGGVIAGIICLVGALNRLPAAEDHAVPLVSEDHQHPG
jgi:hypothetical protein